MTNAAMLADTHDDLPADILADLEAMKRGGQEGDANQERLERISQAIVAKRTLAVNDRKQSGVEEVWRDAEEAYVGIDDANRSDFARARWAKPVSMEGPVSDSRATARNDVRSTVFVRLTARYVDAGAAKLAEILLPPDDKAFSFEPTPLPELVRAKTDETQVRLRNGLPAERDPRPEELAASGAVPFAQAPASPSAAPAPPAPAAPGVQAGAPPMPGAPPLNPQQAPGVPLKVKDLVQEYLDHAKDAAKKGEKRIYDWLVEARYTAAARKIVFDSAKLGVGVLKGPFATVRKSMAAFKDDSGRVMVKFNEKVAPGAKRISPWDLFPDPCCGEDIHHGDYIFERDRLSTRQLRDLKKVPGYLTKQIDKVLAEGPGKKYVDDDKPQKLNDDRFEVWYFYGVLSREDMAIIAPDERIPEVLEEVYAQVTLVNDSVIHAVMNPLDSGKFPYHTMPWQRRDGSWAGIGIAEQVSAPQRMVVAATRAMLNNAGISSGAQIIVDRGSVEPADGSWLITPNKVWYRSGDSSIDDVRKAFAAIEFPSRQAELMGIIEYAFRLAEESTNIPLITQGQSGETMPETFGATQLQNNNANQLLRSVGYAYDDHITEPFIIMMYEWLLLDVNVPDEEKGDWRINAHGSAALVERAIAEQTIAQMAEIVERPAFGVNPKKWFANYLKSKRLDPRDYQWTEEEQAKIDSMPPPKAPQVQAAEIRAQTDLQRAKMDTDRDTVYVQAETQRTQAEMQMQIQELQLKKELETLKRDLEILKLSNARGIAVDQIKADLARDTMKLRVQEKLAADDRAAEVLTPPTEPPGLAPAGQSFER